MLEAILLISLLPRPEKVHVTGYCPCPVCCGKWADGLTASMTVPREDWTLASRQYSIGTWVILDGKLFKVEDRGGPIRRGFDRYYETHARALEHGRKDEWVMTWRRNTTA